jgi:hypothetical protein
MIVATVWAIAAAFMGLKGIRYVARWATYLPIIPLVILLVRTKDDEQIVLDLKRDGGILSEFLQRFYLSGRAAADERAICPSHKCHTYEEGYPCW